MTQTTTLTDAQRALARHALGLPNENHISYRNRYLAADGSIDFSQWHDLENRGLAKSAKSTVWGSDATMFFLTCEGACLAVNDDERLDEEDFGGRSCDEQA